MWNGRVAKISFGDFPQVGQCGHMFGLFARSSTAGHDEIGETNRLVSLACLAAHWVRRSDLPRDVVPPGFSTSWAPCCPFLRLSAGKPVHFFFGHGWRCRINSLDRHSPDFAGDLAGQCHVDDPEGPPSHERDDPFRQRDTAPTVSRVRNCLLPRLEVAPGRSLPPLELERGVSPIEAARSRLVRKPAGSTTNAITVAAMIGPTPGMLVRRRGFSAPRLQGLAPGLGLRPMIHELRVDRTLPAECRGTAQAASGRRRCSIRAKHGINQAGLWATP